MNKETLIYQFINNHIELANHVDGLSEADFIINKNEKWNAAQQIKHVSLCLSPINQSLTSKTFIEQKFGKVNRLNLSYDQIIENYKKALAEGGKAPEKYLPTHHAFEDKQVLLDELHELLKSIKSKLTNYSEIELESLVLPHPLMGIITIKELFYLMSYHATHHLDQVKASLY